MRVFLFATFIAMSACARLDNNYLPPPGAGGAGGGPGLAAPNFGGGGKNGGGGGHSPTGGGGHSAAGGGRPGNGAPGGGAGRPGGGAAPGGGSRPGGGNGGLGGKAPGYSSPSTGFGPSSKPAGGAPLPPLPPGSNPSGANIEIISYENENSGDGNYKWSYETANGIKAQEEGTVKNKGTENEIIVVTGSYSYTAPDGQLISVTYTADENGFQAFGDHLPTPPPIPDAIAKSLQNAPAAPQGPKAPAPAGGKQFPGGPNSQGYPGAPGTPNGNGGGNGRGAASGSFSPQNGYTY